jgi:hypothetical protein
MSIICSDELINKINFNVNEEKLIKEECISIECYDNKIYLHFITNDNKISKTYVYKDFIYNSKINSFKNPLTFNLRSFKKHENISHKIIFINEELFWRGIIDEEHNNK